VVKVFKIVINRLTLDVEICGTHQNTPHSLYNAFMKFLWTIILGISGGNGVKVWNAFLRSAEMVPAAGVARQPGGPAR